MKLLIVGAGPVTRDLLRSLGDAWDVGVVDADPDLLLAAADVRAISAARADPFRGTSKVIPPWWIFIRSMVPSAPRSKDTAMSSVIMNCQRCSNVASDSSGSAFRTLDLKSSSCDDRIRVNSASAS